MKPLTDFFNSILNSVKSKSKPRDFQDTVNTNTLDGSKAANKFGFMTKYAGIKSDTPKNKNYFIAKYGNEIDMQFSKCWKQVKDSLDIGDPVMNFKYHINSPAFIEGIRAAHTKDDPDLKNIFMTKFGHFVQKLKKEHLICNITQDKQTKRFYLVIDIATNIQ